MDTKALDLLFDELSEVYLYEAEDSDLDDFVSET